MGVLKEFGFFKRNYYAFMLGVRVAHFPDDVDNYYEKIKRKATHEHRS